MDLRRSTSLRQAHNFIQWLSGRYPQNVTMSYMQAIFLWLEKGWYAPIPGAWLPGELQPPELANNTEITNGSCSDNNCTSGGSGKQGNIDQYDPWINDVERIIYVYVMPIVCILSVILNAMTIVVLSRRNFQGTPFFLLMGLAATDIFSSIFTLPFGWLSCSYCPKANWWCPVRLFLVTYVILPLTNISENTSAWLTVVMATERYVAVRDPASGKTNGGNRKGRLLFLLVLLGAIALNVPVFFVFKIEADSSNQDLRRAFSHWALSTGYPVYCWVRASLAQFIPLVVLVVMNVLLMSAIHRSQKRCRKISAFSKTCQRQTAQNRLTSMLVGTVILFVLGNIPVAFAYSTLFEFMFGHLNLNPGVYASFKSIAHLLSITSYALDFIVYCVSNRHFRNVMIQVASDTFRRPRSSKVSDVSSASSAPPVAQVLTISATTIKVAPLWSPEGSPVKKQ